MSHIVVMRTVAGVGLVALSALGCTATTPPATSAPVVSFHGISYPIPDGWEVRTTPVTCLAPAPSADTIVVTDDVSSPGCTEVNLPPNYQQVSIHRWMSGVDTTLPRDARRVRWHGIEAYQAIVSTGPPVQIALVVPKLNVEVVVSATANADAQQLLNLVRPQS